MKTKKEERGKGKSKTAAQVLAKIFELKPQKKA